MRSFLFEDDLITDYFVEYQRMEKKPLARLRLSSCQLLFKKPQARLQLMTQIWWPTRHKIFGIALFSVVKKLGPDSASNTSTNLSVLKYGGFQPIVDGLSRQPLPSVYFNQRLTTY